MSKKKILIPFIIFSTLLTTTSVYVYQMLFAPNFLINQKDKFVIIEDNTSFEELRENLIENKNFKFARKGSRDNFFFCRGGMTGSLEAASPKAPHLCFVVVIL